MHTPNGKQILHNFLFSACACAGDWTVGSFVEEAVAEVRERVGDGQVVCGLSGGVDSSVMALLLGEGAGRTACTASSSTTEC